MMCDPPRTLKRYIACKSGPMHRLPYIIRAIISRNENSAVFISSSVLTFTTRSYDFNAILVKFCMIKLSNTKVQQHPRARPVIRTRNPLSHPSPASQAQTFLYYAPSAPSPQFPQTEHFDPTIPLPLRKTLSPSSSLPP